jgi:phage terminase large subunit-like protein
VNPSWGETINTLEFTRDFENSLTNAANEGEFKRYRLNMPTRTVTPWIQYNYWDKCLKSSEKWLGKRPERHRQIYLGVDLAESIDLVAGVAIWEENDESLPEETGQTVICVEASFFAPAEAGITANQSNRERYEQWWEGGHMVQLPGNVVPIGAVEMALVNDYRNHDVKKVGVDKYNAMRFKNRMEQLIAEFDLGWEIELQSYNGMSMNEPTRFLAELIVGNKLRLVNPEVLTWMFGNLRAAIDSSGNMKLDKKNSLNKIDGFAALCMALAAFVNDDPEFHSRYENNKVSTIDVIL